LNAIATMAGLLGCNPPEKLADGGTPARVVWSRSAAIHDTPETVRDSDGKPVGLVLIVIAPTDIGPETTVLMIFIPLGATARPVAVGTVRGIDADHIRPEDDLSGTRSIWHYGADGKFDTRGWAEDLSAGSHSRTAPSDGPVSTTLEQVLEHATAQPFLVVVETEEGTQWRCLVLHEKPAPHIAESVRARLVDAAGGVED
jgi:hypothetical protein